MSEYWDGQGVWRDLYTGVNPLWGDVEWNDGANDQPGTPSEPIATRLEGPWGLPYFEGTENPTAATGLFKSPDPTYPFEDIGAQPIVGAYEGAYRTVGSVQAWGYEPSGGIGGDQARGRIMRFPANIPDRYDPNGVWNVDYRDELAGALLANDAPDTTEDDINTSLLMYPSFATDYIYG